MSNDLVEEVARAICFNRNAPTCLCTKETGCLASLMVRVEATQARAVVAAVVEWLDSQVHMDYENRKFLIDTLREQLEGNE